MTDIKKKLQDEIAALEYELHVELPREILKARAHGDLSENAEYHAAKDRQGFVNARLNQLKKRLAEMSMIDFSKIPHGKVGLGSTVVVLDSKRDEEITYNLVTSEEADAANGKISTTSPSAARCWARKWATWPVCRAPAASRNWRSSSSPPSTRPPTKKLCNL